MKSTSLILSALGIYVLAAACVLWPVSAPGGAGSSPQMPAVEPVLGAGAALSGLPYRGVTMQIQRPDWMDKYKKSIDEIAAVGADTVKLVIDARQENGSS